MKLFFDCETNGLKNPKRIVSIAWIISDSKKVFSEKSYIVKPLDFRISYGAIRIHRITQEIALREGNSIKIVLKEFIKDVREYAPDSLVAHNIAFDFPILIYELEQIELKHGLNKLDRICTMRGSREFCKLPNKSGLSYKLPKLEELYKILFHKEFKNAHEALADTQACKECYLGLIEAGVLPPETKCKLPKEIKNKAKKKSSTLKNNLKSKDAELSYGKNKKTKHLTKPKSNKEKIEQIKAQRAQNALMQDQVDALTKQVPSIQGQAKTPDNVSPKKTTIKQKTQRKTADMRNSLISKDNEFTYKQKEKKRNRPDAYRGSANNAKDHFLEKDVHSKFYSSVLEDRVLSVIGYILFGSLIWCLVIDYGAFGFKPIFFSVFLLIVGWPIFFLLIRLYKKIKQHK